MTHKANFLYFSDSTTAVLVRRDGRYPQHRPTNLLSASSNLNLNQASSL